MTKLVSSIVIGVIAALVSVENGRAAVMNSVYEAQTDQQNKTQDELASLNSPVQFERFRAAVLRDGFTVTEEALLAELAAASNEQRYDAVLQLVYFYMANDLFPEALAVINEQESFEDAPEWMLLKGVASYKMGRNADAAEIFASKELKSVQSASPWRGMTNEKLGAYKDAAYDLITNESRGALMDTGATDYMLAKISTAIQAGDASLARKALNELRGNVLDARQRAHRDYLEATLLTAQGNAKSAQRTYQNLVADGPAPYSNLASLALIKQAYSTGESAPHDALNQIDHLLLTWRGGAFERSALVFIAALSDEVGDVERAFTARRQLLQHHSASDAASEAILLIRAGLENLFQHPRLTPLSAARIFYENVDFAPPGQEGDALIRKVADDLVELDLLKEAGELMRHQIFTRLRGEERSRAAADLAEIYLSDQRQLDALTVLRSTRLTRLPEALNDRRRLLEASALYETDRKEMALSLLEADESKAASVLRAEIYFADKDWASAGNAFAAAVEKSYAADGDLSPRYVEAALKAAACFALAGQEQRLTAFVDRASSYINDPEAQILLRGLAYDGLFEDPAAFQAAFSIYLIGASAES